jgi:hypothetical protein
VISAVLCATAMNSGALSWTMEAKRVICCAADALAQS